MRHLNLRAKILAGGCLMLAIPSLLIGIVAVYVSDKGITDAAESDMASIAEGYASTIGTAINDQILTARNIASSASVIAAADTYSREGEKNAGDEIAVAESELIRIKDNVGERCSSVNLINPAGLFYASSNRKANVGIDVSERDYFKTAKGGTPNAGSVVVSKSSGRIVLSSASPVYAPKGKAVTSVAMIAMEIKYLTDMIDMAKFGKTGYLTIEDRIGLTIAHPDKEIILKENITQVAGMEALARMVTGGKSGIVEYRRNGVAKVAYVAHEPVTGWSVVATIEASDLFAPAISIRNLISVIGAVSLLLSLVILVLFSKSLTDPIVKVAEAAKKIAAGDLDVMAASLSRQDEIGVLSRSFAVMVQSLKETSQVAKRIASGDLTMKVQPLSETDVLGNAFAAMVEKLRKHMSGITEGFTVLSSAGSEILAATTQVVSSTTETASAINETITTVEEVRQAARLSSDKAKNVSNNAQRITQSSQIGRLAVEETTAGMLNIRDQMESITQAILRLSEQSQSIGGIISAVTDLADQSNLLAVNAAIEAARAGEQGRGFAVVALEIKSLAEQSKAATAQIRGILGEIQKATGAAVMATERGSKAVEAGVKQSVQAGDSIRVLAESSAEAVQAATQIAASSQQQVVGMDQIGLAMENIGQAGTQTAASIKQAEASAQNLHELGQKLKLLVEQYRT
jgi:methyl-accepting chemotaxis protein